MDNKKFKVWDNEVQSWVTDYFDDYVEIVWYWNGPDLGKCYIQVKQDIEAEIVWPDSNGVYNEPE